MQSVFLWFLLMYSASAVLAGILSHFHLPRALKVDPEGARPPRDVLEICWGDRKLTIAPRAVSTLIEYFRVCTNAVTVLAPEQEPHLLSTLRNKIYNALPDLNKAFLYNAVTYDEIAAVETALNNVEKIMVEKQMTPTVQLKEKRWLTINTTNDNALSKLAEESNMTDLDKDPCKDLVVLDGIDKDSNVSIKFIPTPYQDHPQRPQYLAIPFNKRFLYDIHKKDSANILRKYYTESVRCLKSFNDHHLRRFQDSLYNVIVDKFIPVIKQEPHRVLPGYGSILEILDDIINSLTSNTTYPSEETPFYLGNFHFKKLARSKSVKSNPLKYSRDWVWGNSDSNTESNSFFKSLLFLLVIILVVNGLCYVSTLVFFLVFKKGVLSKTDSSDRSYFSLGSKSSKHSDWTEIKSPGTELLGCLCNRDSERDEFKEKRDVCDKYDTQAMMLHQIQHIRCPHNFISPRPEHYSLPHTAGNNMPQTVPTTNIGENGGEGVSTNVRTKQAHRTSGRKMYQIKDFSIFKPPGYKTLKCQKLKSARGTEEGVQSIQGTDEFQRIVRELNDVQRSLQHLQASRVKQAAKNRDDGGAPASSRKEEMLSKNQLERPRSS